MTVYSSSLLQYVVDTVASSETYALHKLLNIEKYSAFALPWWKKLPLKVWEDKAAQGPQSGKSNSVSFEFPITHQTYVWF